MSYKIRQSPTLKGMTGAIGGVFWPNHLIKKVFGQELESGPAFAYLFRRFGYPVYGWDGYKELCQYHLTTPMRGVGLWVSLKTGVDFGYMLTEKLERVCFVEKRAPYNAWQDRFRSWAKTKGYSAISRWDFTREELDTVGYPWMAERGLTDEMLTDEIIRQFWDEQDAKLKVWREEYSAIEPFPERSDDEIYGETRLKVWTALERAMRELLRPVRVRDTVIDIFGRVDSFGRFKPLEESPMAGVGFGWLYDIYEDEHQRERWWDAVDNIRKLGHGDLLTGIETLLSRIETPETEA